MQIDLLCNSPDHPVIIYLSHWISARQSKHELRLVHDKSELKNGDILFLISCSQIIDEADRAMYKHVLVLHASDLPSGRGWSPHIWDLLAGKEELTVSLLTAQDPVDTGPIWAKLNFFVPRDAVYDEINDLLFENELALMDRGIEMVRDGEQPIPQQLEEGTYYRRRGPDDSRLDPESSLVDLFDLIRVSDPERFPAHFEMHGKIYNLTISKREV